MLIAIDASRANRSHKSGTEWYSYYLIKYLSWLDRENQYILYTDKPLSGGLADLGNMNLEIEDVNRLPVYNKKGCQIIKSPFGNFRGHVLKWPFSCFWTLARLSLQMFFDRPDVLFVPAHGLPLWRSGKVVNTIHDVAFRSHPTDNVYDKRRLGPSRSLFLGRIVSLFVRTITIGRFRANSLDYLNWSTEYSLKHSDLILAVSEHTKKEIIANYPRCDASKIKVVHNGYNEDIYHEQEDQPKVSDILNKYGLTKPYILYVGRLERKKNTPFLIEAFAKLKQRRPDLKEKLVLVGDASFGYNEVKCLIDQNGLSSEIILAGWVKEEDMPYITAGAEVYVLPSRHEGFGITILQALASGVPTVASNIPVLREVAGEAAIFFNPNSKEEMSLAMEKLIVNKNLRVELIARGLERVKNFGWEKCAQETLATIEMIKTMKK
ncbi:MAG: glycosyltransferase family 1 protein [Patescibacteria group bacterium]|jgi:glycosyltransferase involved in cell wall biosynthesis